KLAAVADFSRRLCAEIDCPTRIATATDLREGLRGASHVLNQVKVGGSGVWHRCQHLLRSFGIEGHALNSGGAVSNREFGLGLAQAVLEAAPQAWLIEFTNPCGLHAEAFARHAPGLKVVTGCNMPLREREAAAALLGLEVRADRPGGLEIAWFGFNHC